ncbi:hypothetical protein SAMN04487934_105172 [Eubacterium ruminantium]|nr:hypothetical protein SAMN04487934_105172 [Eubacterium ruminantium]
MAFYKALLYGGIGVAIVFLILTIVLFFVLKIPAVIGNLTGSTQKKRIEEIRKTGYESISKDKAIHDSTSKITVREAEMKTKETGALTSGGSGSLKEDKKKKYKPRPNVGAGNADPDTQTELLGYSKYGSAAGDPEEDNTEILTEEEMAVGGYLEGTDVLRRGNSGGAAVRTEGGEDETAILGDDMYDTDLDEDMSAISEGQDSESITSVLSEDEEEEELDLIGATSTGVEENRRQGNSSSEALDSVIRDEAGEDITSVLRGGPDVHTFGVKTAGPVKERSKAEKDDTDYSSMIKVLYSVTVVNTSEELDS